MNVALVLIHDGRQQYLLRTLASCQRHLDYPFSATVTIDDSDHRLGFGGAVREGWRQALETDADYVFHLEGDFVFEREIPLGRMVAALQRNPQLVQMALVRQPWNATEKRLGSILRVDAECYAQVEQNGERFIVHRRNVTTNPSLWPRWVLERGWPECSESEGVFGGELFKSDETLQAAYWGGDEVWVRHIGEVRAGHGY